MNFAIHRTRTALYTVLLAGLICYPRTNQYNIRQQLFEWIIIWIFFKLLLFSCLSNSFLHIWMDPIGNYKYQYYSFYLWFNWFQLHFKQCNMPLVFTSGFRLLRLSTTKLPTIYTMWPSLPRKQQERISCFPLACPKTIFACPKAPLVVTNVSAGWEFANHFLTKLKKNFFLFCYSPFLHA